MISLQTNVTSLDAQNNLNTDNLAQSKTIQQLSSGYRINSSGDDAAGLAIANQLRDNIAELTQGVNNASTGIAQLQIVDGGLSNISTILDRMKTLATESASGTFTGDRGTLNQEYQGLIAEITRQAGNINLNSGGSFNSKLSVYIGGASTLTNAGVTVDLSGSQNAVDATSLGLASTNVLGNATGFAGNTKSLTNGVTLTANETFTLNVISGGAAQNVSTISVAAGTYSSQGLLNNLNSQLSQYGITASLNSSGELQFSSANAFNIKDTTSTLGLISTGATASLYNSGNYDAEGQATYAKQAETLTVAVNGQTYQASINDATAAAAVTDLNTQLANSGVYAMLNAAGTGIEFQSASSFTISTNTAGGVFTATGAQTVTVPSTSASPTANADAAITAINAAIQQLGLVQGRVGAGENLLQYATNLANSQITNFSTAQSDIRDANVAADASQLTQSQVLEQTAVAAMAQANSSSQVVLKLLQ